jgi:predicted amidophosphoribosyltransferase
VVANVGVAAAGAYAGVLRRGIVAMKQGERAYLNSFAEFLAAITPRNVPLVPLPTSRGRRAARGFDQAVELARRVAVLNGGSCCEVLVKRGMAQRGLDRRARLEAGGRFRIKPGAALPELAIAIDDVWTTGATLSDGIATLREAGVAVIGAVVLARTAPGRNPRR